MAQANAIPDPNSLIIAIESIKVIKSGNGATSLQAQPETLPEAGSSHIGPFGWVGIAFLCCLVFACATNIYLKIQKKEYETPPSPAQLRELAPGVYEPQN